MGVRPKSDQIGVGWYAMKEFSMDELIAKGDGIYRLACAGCHQVNGRGDPGAFPVFTSNSRAAGSIAAHTDIVVDGKAGTAMQALKEKESSVDLAVGVTYQRKELGNSMDNLVQPGAIR